MANKFITLDSGAKLEVQMASFANAHRLLKAFAHEAEQVKLNIGVTQVTAGELLKMKNLTPDTYDMLKNFIARMIGSEELEAALWPCMQVVLYNSKPVSRETFEKEDARQDFLPVMREVLMANLIPFGAGLGSLLKAAEPVNTASQK